ncbi:MAG: PAS domain S-box protein, partial [Nitrospirales bacterium]
MVPSSPGLGTGPVPFSILLASQDAQDVKLASTTLRQFFPGCRIEAVYTPLEVAEWAAKPEWQVLVVDESIIGAQEREFLAELKRLCPKAGLVVQTAQNDVGRTMRALDHGADACLFKHAPDALAQLVGGVQRALVARCRSPQGRSRLQAVLDLIGPVGGVLYELDAQGRFLYVSPAIESLWGYATGDLVGEHFTALFPPDERWQVEHRFNERRTGLRATHDLPIRIPVKPSRPGAHRSRDFFLHATGYYAPDRTFLGTMGLVEEPAQAGRPFSSQDRRAAALARSAGQMLDDLRALLSALLTLSDSCLQAAAPEEAQTRKVLEKVRALNEVAADLSWHLRRSAMPNGAQTQGAAMNEVRSSGRTTGTSVP